MSVTKEFHTATLIDATGCGIDVTPYGYWVLTPNSRKLTTRHDKEYNIRLSLVHISTQMLSFSMLVIRVFCSLERVNR